MWYVFVIPFVIFFVVFLFIAKSFFRSHKHAKDTMEDMVHTITAYAEKQVEETLAQPKEETKICEYCGSTVASGSKKCDSCGAKVKK